MRNMLALFILVIFISSFFGWRTFRVYQAKLTKESLKIHVKRLSDDIGDRSVFKYDKLIEAKDYVVNELKSYGYEVEYHGYTLHNRYTENIIVNKKGKARPDEVIIIGAHYDTCFNPGADDNASSIAGLLELARMFSSVETDRTIRFIAFVNEEPPFFKTENMGSYQYVLELKEKNEDIKGVLILEMIGCYSNKLFSQHYPPLFGLFYPNRANFIAVIGNFRSRQLAKLIKKSFRRHSKFPIESVSTFGFVPGVDFSDNWSFWKLGYPAVMITDTAFYRYSYYHSNQDTYEKLNYNCVAEVVNGLYLVLDELTR